MNLVRFPLVIVLLVGAALPRPASAQEVSGLTALSRSMTEAEARLTAQEPQAAESLYRDAVQEGWLLLGGLHAAAGDLERAHADFERAATVAAEVRRAHTALAAVELRLGRAEDAVRRLRSVVARHPENRAAKRLLAQSLIAAGSPAEAVQELREMLVAIREDGEGGAAEAETAFALASGYLRMDDVERADELFADVTRLLPRAATHVLIGRTYRDFRHFDRATRSLETALRLDPDVRRGHYYLGTVALLDQGRDALDGAVDHFRSELEDAPDDPMTHLYLGMALVETRRCEEALPSLDVAADWAPTRLDALRFSGRCRLELGDTAAAVDRFEEALELADRTEARPRQLSAIHYQLATALRRQGKEDEAARQFALAEEISGRLIEGERDRYSLEDNAALEPSADGFDPKVAPAEMTRLDPQARDEIERRVSREMARAYLNLGTLQARRERFGQAADLFGEAAGLDPELPRVQLSWGAALFRAERFADAVAPLSAARGESPADRDDLDLDRMLALALFNAEDYDRAAALLADDPGRETDPALGYAYGLALVRSGRMDEAERFFDRLIAQHADWPELHLLLGQANAQQNDYPAAIASLERALSLNPQIAEAHGTLGVLYLRQGRLEEAESSLRAELENHPEDLRARYHLAVVLDLEQQPDRATDELRQVLAGQPGHADARYLLGKIRLAQGAADEAAQHLEAAAALAPEDANVRYQLAQAYRRQGQGDKADGQLEIYRRLKGRDGESGS